MSFGMRLKEARTKKGMTRDDLAKLIGVSRAAISNYENEISHPKESIIYKLFSALQVDANFLFQDDIKTVAIPVSDAAQRIGRAYDRADPPVQRTVEVALEPYMEDTGHADTKEECADDSDKFKIEMGQDLEPQLPMAMKRSDGFTEIKVYDQPAAAGLGNYLDEPDYHTEQYPTAMVPFDVDFGVRISGDSMEPLIRDGSTVFVKQSLEINGGQIGIFVLNGVSYCKRLIVDRQKREVRLSSENKAYGDIVIKEYDDLRTVGRVVGAN